MPKELPSVEEALKLLARAINALQTPNLSKAEVARLRTIITAVKTYKELLADYIDYRQIEAKLLEMKKRIQPTRPIRPDQHRTANQQKRDNKFEKYLLA